MRSKKTNKINRNKRQRRRTFKRGGVEPEETPEPYQRHQAINEEPERVPEQEEEEEITEREAIIEKPDELNEIFEEEISKILMAVFLKASEKEVHFNNFKPGALINIDTQKRLTELLEKTKVVPEKLKGIARGIIIKRYNTSVSDTRYISEADIITLEKGGIRRLSIIGFLGIGLSQSSTEADDVTYQLITKLIEKLGPISLTSDDIAVLKLQSCLADLGENNFNKRKVEKIVSLSGRIAYARYSTSFCPTKMLTRKRMGGKKTKKSTKSMKSTTKKRKPIYRNKA